MRKHEKKPRRLLETSSSCRLIVTIAMNFGGLPTAQVRIDKRHAGAALPLTSHGALISTSNFLLPPTKNDSQGQLKMRSIGKCCELVSFLLSTILLPRQPHRLPWQAWTVEHNAAARGVVDVVALQISACRASVKRLRVAVCCSPAVSPAGAI